jgi:hypothetical protein
VPIARGIQTPLAPDAIVAKFRILTEGIVSPERVKRIEDHVHRLEKLRDIKELIGLLADRVGPVFG